jgi:malate dehydrogenase (oxaloacetate-decarboxylating)
MPHGTPIFIPFANFYAGIGDQGVGGILISVAKLVLTTLCGGIHPNRTLAVALDCGTDNEELLKDDLYMGLRQRRVRGEEYDEFVDTFVQSARKLYPRAYIHFEDFGLDNARRVCYFAFGAMLH